MGRSRYTHVVLSLAVLIAAACAGPGHQPSLAASSDETPAPLDASRQRRLHLASLVLAAKPGEIDQESRLAAAAELVALDAPQSREVLINVIQKGHVESWRAVIRALQEASTIDPMMQPVLLNSLPTTPAELIDQMTLLIARYGQHDAAVLRDLATMANDADRPDSERLAAITAIGSFRHDPARAAAQLAGILGASTPPPPDVARAAMSQLSRLTGLPPHHDRSRWLAWWNDNRDRPSERWLQDMVDALTRTVESQTAELAAVRADRDALAERVLATYRAFWPTLPIEQQQSMLLSVLQDDLAAVRSFGVERLGVHLRDGHGTQEGQIAAMALLGDEDAGVRRAAAVLLPELDPKIVQPDLAARFPEESDPHVLNAMLPRVATIEPTLVTAARLKPLLADPSTRDAALAAAQVVLGDRARRDLAIAEGIRADVHRAFADDSGPAAASVLALVGTREDASMLANMLSEAQPAWRTAVGESLLARGEYTPLLERANDPVIYPLALRAAAHQSGMPGLKGVLALTPSAQHKDIWLKQILTTANAIDPSDALAADDLLVSADALSQADRAAVLQNAYGSEGAPDELRVAIAERLAPLVLETGDPRAVVALIDRLPSDTIDDTLQNIRFDAAVRGRLFDEAASMNRTPSQWIEAYERLSSDQPEAADLLRTEIVRRYQQELTDDQRERLGVAIDPMMTDGDGSEPPA